MVILGIHTMRKRGLTFAEALKAGRYQVTHGGPPPPPKQDPPTNFWPDAKKQDMSDYGSLRNQSVTPPQAAMARSGSIKSQKPLASLDRSDSFNLTRTASSRDEPKTFYLQSPPARNNSHSRNGSGSQPSNAPQYSTNNTNNSIATRTMYDEESELQYNDPPQDRAVSPLPPPPTFKQFLSNRPSGSVKQGFDNMMSRFSWTNSNAPQTPHDSSRDTKATPVNRDSYMTSRSSVPRFRTVDSWVNQQTNRIEAQKLKEQFRLTSTTVGSQDSEARDIVPDVPEVPAMPKNVQALRDSSAHLSSQLPNRRPVTPPGLPGRNVKHQRHDTRTTVDTAPIFRQHPGNEVRFSTKSDVPSEILDRGRRDDVLS